MASKYDKIQTASDLVMEVKFHGMSLAQEDILRAQDIFGHSTIEELDTLANDIGRNNENGEPDPNGTWSSTRVPTRDTFYFILFHIWNWEDATRFWNQHSNPDRKEIADAKIEHQHLMAEIKRLKADKEKAEMAEATMMEKYNNLIDSYDANAEALERAQQTIIELKAKLYDLMC